MLKLSFTRTFTINVIHNFLFCSAWRLTPPRFHGTVYRSRVSFFNAVESSYSPPVSAPKPQPATDSLEVRAWIDKWIPLNSAMSLEAIKAMDGKSCIIDSPELTMANEYLDQVTLNENVEIIESALENFPDTRSKALVGTVMGSGGGKTRLLEECRRCINKNCDYVVLTITFNKFAKYYRDEEQFIEGQKFLPFNMLMSVLVRVYAVVFDMAASDVKYNVKCLMGNLDKSQFLNTDHMIKMFRYAMGRIVRAINESNNIRLKGVVLMIDETIVLRDSNADDDQINVRVQNSFRESMMCLRGAMLNEYILDDDHGLKAALVISSLELAPFEKTDSSRDISFLRCPKILEEDVLDKWWLSGGVQCEPKHRSCLKRIASTLLSVPRLLEFAKDYIDEKLIRSIEKMQNGETIRLSTIYTDQKSIKDMFVYI